MSRRSASVERGRSKRGGIGRAMAAVAGVAAWFGLMRGADPLVVGAYGPLLGLMLWLLFEGVARRRRLGGFHYATAIVAVPASGIIATQIAMDRFRPLGAVVRLWQWTSGDLGIRRGWEGTLYLAEFAAGGLLSLLLGLAAGTAVRRLEGARGWDLGPFFRGGVVGAFLSVPLLFALFPMALPPDGPAYGDRFARLAVLAAGFLIGGRVEVGRCRRA